MWTGIVNKVHAMSHSAYGWAVFAGAGVLELIGGYEMAICSVLASVVLDLIWGVWAAVIRGKFAKSELMRETVSKITAYMTAVLLFILAEKNLPGDSFWLTSTLSAIIIATEFWSISGNILIVNPDAVFFKLLRPALKGELASKLGVSEDKVDEVLNDRPKKHKKK